MQYSLRHSPITCTLAGPRTVAEVETNIEHEMASLPETLWAELHDFVMTLPAKYETHIGEGGMSLSGGQKQRMALAMTLITDPSILILDDSTSALDARTEGRVHKTLERIMEGRTAFVITQKVSMARKADLVLVLEKGRLVEWGTHDVLVKKQGVYYELFETQLSDGEKGRMPELVELAV